MRFHIVTLGCPKNTVDSEMMAELLRQAGHEAVATPRWADAIIVNTCGFIASARDETYEALATLARKKRRGQRLIAAGCLAQRLGAEILEQAPGVDAVIGTQSWPDIVSLFEQLSAPHSRPPVFRSDRGELVRSVARTARGATSYLKIADGCDAACGFCAIPLIKGRQQSKPADQVVREAQELARAGVREVVLIAQDTTAYGRDLGSPGALAPLLLRITQEAPDLTWLRILYAYPQSITVDLIETMAELPSVCHYLDLPLQHGHPQVLARMRRPHDLDQIHRIVAALRGAMPDIALRSTFIVGYPGETETEFEGLLDLLDTVAFDHVGVFAYSREEGTYAASLPDQVPAQVAAERYERAMQRQQAISERRNQDQVGRELDILVDGAGDGLTVGRSYREAPEIDGMVLLAGEYSVGQMVRGRIVAAQEYDLVAEPV